MLDRETENAHTIKQVNKIFSGTEDNFTFSCLYSTSSSILREFIGRNKLKLKNTQFI